MTCEDACVAVLRGSLGRMVGWCVVDSALAAGRTMTHSFIHSFILASEADGHRRDTELS